MHRVRYCYDSSRVKYREEMFGVSLKFSLIPAGSHNFCHMSAGVLSAARLHTKDHSSLLQHDTVKSMIKHVKYALGWGNFVIESFYQNQIQSWLSSPAPPSHPNKVTSYSKKKKRETTMAVMPNSRLQVSRQIETSEQLLDGLP